MTHPTIETIASKKKWAARDAGRAYLYYFADVLGVLPFAREKGESRPPTGIISLSELELKVSQLSARTYQETVKPYADTVLALSGVINYISQVSDTLEIAIHAQKVNALAVRHPDTRADLIRYTGDNGNDLAILLSVRHISAYNRIIRAIAEGQEVPHLNRIQASTQAQDRQELEELRAQTIDMLAKEELEEVPHILGSGEMLEDLARYEGTEAEHEGLTRRLLNMRALNSNGIYKLLDELVSAEAERDLDKLTKRLEGTGGSA